jgi:DNA polymerase-3 subunit alpha
MTQYSMDPVAKLGLLKMDFLGLTNLTILDRAVKLVEKNQGIKIDLDRLRLDDKPTFELLSSGNTTDLFQLESAGMRRYIKELKPSNLGDIAAMIALYRPGPMENIDSFIAAKYGRIPITYPHPSFKDLLDETYGIIVYQDQVLLILQQFAGYTLGEADIVRKAMGKKIASLMAAERERFVSGALANGYDSDVARTIFDLIEPFAGYAFNKAHSISYALISYWTAYFKTHYPLEYMGSVLNSRMDHPEKMVTSINECFQLGIPVLLPDINKSDELFAIDEGDGTAPGLRVGLAAVKTVGESAVRPLLEERDANGPYKSIDDFCRRANGGGLNRRTMESLAKAGAFDSLAPRGAVLGALDQIVALAQLEARNRDSGQSSLFSDASGEAGGGVLPGVDLSNFDVSSEQKVAWEQELLGVALSENPRRQLAALNTGDAFNSMDQLEDEMQGQTLSVLGYVSSVTERYTKEQKKFLVVAMELLGGSLEVVVWPNVLEQTQDKWVQGAILLVTGRLQLRNDQLTLACDKVQQYQEDRMPPPSANGNGKHRANGNNGAASAASNGVSSNGAAANGHKNGSAGGQQASSRQPAEEKTSNGAGSRTVSLAVKESDNAREDAHLLREVIGVLLEYSGHDRVNLDIKTVAGRVLMELPTVSTSYCEELDRRVSELLGAESVRLYVEAPQN